MNCALARFERRKATRLVHQLCASLTESKPPPQLSAACNLQTRRAKQYKK